MKTYILKPSTAAPKATVVERMPSLLKWLSAPEKLHPEPARRAPLCIGGDLEKAGACLAIQVGAESIAGTVTLCRAEVAGLVQELIARGWRIAVGGEACGFGWVFQTQLRGAGAEVFTFATGALTGRRKTNQIFFFAKKTLSSATRKGATAPGAAATFSSARFCN